MWEHSLSFFGENNHHMVQFLQKNRKKYFEKHNAKKNLQIIILHVLQLLKKY